MHKLQNSGRRMRTRCRGFSQGPHPCVVLLLVLYMVRGCCTSNILFYAFRAATKILRSIPCQSLGGVPTVSYLLHLYFYCSAPCCFRAPSLFPSGVERTAVLHGDECVFFLEHVAIHFWARISIEFSGDWFVEGR